jgi:hypothetical protein
VADLGSHNTELKDLSSYFTDAAKFDLRLKPGAPAIDQGRADGAPELDADRIPRPQGAGVDLGAYESHDAKVQPVDGGSGEDFAPPPPAAGKGGAGAGGSGSGAGAGGRAGSSGQPKSGSGGAGGHAGKGGTDTRDAGSDVDAGEPPKGHTDCGCRISRQRSSGAGAIGVAALALVLRRRRLQRRARARR